MMMDDLVIPEPEAQEPGFVVSDAPPPAPLPVAGTESQRVGRNKHSSQELRDAEQVDMKKVAAILYGKREHAAAKDRDRHYNGILPDVGPLPDRIEPNTFPAFVWLQRERRKIFVQEVEEIRAQWTLRRQPIVDKFMAQQRMLEAMLEELWRACDGREWEVDGLQAMMTDVEDKMRTLKESIENEIGGEGVNHGEDNNLEAVNLDKLAEELDLVKERVVDEDGNVIDEWQTEKTKMDRKKETFRVQSWWVAMGLYSPTELAPRENLLVRIVTSRPFEGWCLFVIVAQAIIMGISAQWDANQLFPKDIYFRNHDFGYIVGDYMQTVGGSVGLATSAPSTGSLVPDEDNPWDVFEWIFYAWYIFEVVVKLVAFRLNFFTNVDRNWNLFDVFCIFPWSVIIDATTDGSGSSGLSFFRIIRLLKLAKMLRVIRLMRFFRELRLMMYMMIKTSTTTLWSLVLMVMIMYVFTIIILMGYENFLRSAKRDKFDLKDEISRSLWSHWGGVWPGMKTLYWTTTRGIDWGDTSLDLQGIGAIYHGAFLVYVVLTILGIGNIFVGMFTTQAAVVAGEDAATVMAEEQKRKDGLMKATKNALHRIDIEKSNLISWDEFETLSEMNKDVQDFLGWLDLGLSQAKQLFRALAGGEDVNVDIDLFLWGCTQVKGSARRSQITTCRRFLQQFMDQTKCMMVYFEDSMDKLYPQAAETHSQKIPVMPLGPRLRLARYIA